MQYTKWWKPSEDPVEEADRAGALLSETGAIEQRQGQWYDQNLWNATLFSNREPAAFRWGVTQADGEMFPHDLRTENLVEEIGSAMLSKASTSPLKPTPIPHGRSYKTEKAIRRLDQFITATWRQVDAEESAVLSFLDAYIAGIGCVKVDYDEATNSLSTLPVFFDNLVIDNREAANRHRPRHYRIRQALLRSQVEELYPGAKLGQQNTYGDRPLGDGYVIVVEAWRLPSKGGDGRHVIACCGELLLDEDWPHDWVPLSFFHWEDPVSGFFPRTGVEMIVPFQLRMNDLNEKIELSQDVSAIPRIIAHAGSNLDTSQWDTEVGRILGYSGIEPKPFNWTSQLQHLYGERKHVREGAHQYMGISTFTSQADLPPSVRLDSSAGVREFQQLEESRHLRRWTRYERHRLQIATLILKVLAHKPGATAFAAVYHPHGARAAAKSIPYEDVKVLTEDVFSWSMEATPLSMMAPAARRELIRDWDSRGLIDKSEARRMEGNSNLERVEDLEMASYDDILRHLEILEEGGYEAPNELTNLVYGVPRVTANMHRLRNYDDVKPSVIQAHLNWILTGMAIQVGAVQQQQMFAPSAPMQTAAFQPTQGMAGTSAAMNAPA